MPYLMRGCATAVALSLPTLLALSLAAQAPPLLPGQGAAAAPVAGCGPPPAPGRSGIGAGPNDLPIVDEAAADRARPVYAALCINCHGTQARGTGQGANLVRSVVVLRDRCGTELGPFLKKGHPAPDGGAAPPADAQITDLAHFLRQRVNDSLRGSPIFKPGNVLTGDASAGATFFNGDGKCSTCHDRDRLAGIGSRMAPVDIQQRFLFPRTGRGRGGPAPASAVTVSVTPKGGPAVAGVLVQMDDFNVSLRDASGAYHSFKRMPGLAVVKTDPLAAHIALLDTISDRQIHDVVAYLETLR